MDKFLLGSCSDWASCLLDEGFSFLPLSKIQEFDQLQQFLLQKLITFPIRPEIFAGTSSVTLSVSNSTIGSSTST